MKLLRVGAGLVLPLLLGNHVAATLPDPTQLPAGEGWTTLFRHECNGGYEFTPKMPFGLNLDIPSIEKALIAVFKKIEARAKCVCPTLSTADFMLMYDPVTAFLNTLNPSTATPTTACSGKFPATLLNFADYLNVSPVPSTCTLATWRATGTCTGQYSIPDLEVNLGVSAWKCFSGSPLPGLAVNCLGAGCQQLFKPCSTSSDCSAGLSCSTFGSLSDQQHHIFDVMQAIGLYDESEFPGCLNDGSSSTSTNAGAFFMTYMRSLWPNNALNTKLGMCGIYEIQEGALRRAFDDAAIDLEQVAGTNTGCLGTDKQILTLSNLAAWDGTISSGVVATTPGQTLLEPSLRGVVKMFVASDVKVCLPGLFPVTSGQAVRALQITCDGQILVADGQIRLKLSPWAFTQAISYFTQLVKASQDCQVSTPWTAAQFNIRYGLWTLGTWLFAADSTASGSLGSTPPNNDWLTDIQNILNGLKMKLPSTCTYATWKSTGKCTVSFTGLQNLALLGLDVVININVQQCSTSVWPSVNIDCIGADCQYLMGPPKICATDGDCGSNAVCTDVRGSLRTESIFWNDNWLDPIGAATAYDQSNICNLVKGTGSDPTSCGGNAKGQAEIDYIMQYAFGGTSTATGARPTDQVLYCTPFIASNFGDRGNDWIDSQGSINAHQILSFTAVNSLASYTDPDPSPYVPIDVTTTTAFASTGSGTTNAADGASCTSNANCASRVCTDSFCQSGGKSGLGASCATGDDCTTANCLRGVCAVLGKLVDLGGPCTSNSDCGTNNCVSSVCHVAVVAAGARPASLVQTTSHSLVGVAPNVSTTFALPGNCGMSLNSASSATVNVTVAPSPPANVAEPPKGIATYYSFNITTGGTFKANLTFVYADDLLTQYGYDAKDLKWSRYDTTSRSWQAQIGTVDTDTKVVRYTTSQFSTWSIVAQATANGALVNRPTLAVVALVSFGVAVMTGL
ncbi:hypothetical protein HKX48_008705 [Thoreauomyces humboldtii]|nr:hypothetical protein HKX48_008705 [Thoreauomyces humboldtii]